MLELANKYMEIHKQAWEEWTQGEIEEIWTDKDGILCIRYQSGNWWHYKVNNGQLEWW